MHDLLDSSNPSGRDRHLATAALETSAPERTVARRDAQPSRVPVLLFEHVSKWYGPVLGVNKVSLELHGGITGLVGANGAGKSTLMRIATGQIIPDTGRAHVCGHGARSTDALLRVGYSPEIDTFYEEMTGRRFVRTMARLCGYCSAESKARTESVLRQVDMADDGDRKIQGYSKGMRQRIKLAQALLHDPELLVLDEPFSGIDPVGRRELSDLFHKLADQGKCLLISSHQLDELEKLTDHVVVMSNGRIAAVGTIAQIRARLADQPTTLRIDVRNPHGEESRARSLAASLTVLPEVIAIELIDRDPWDASLARLLVRTTSASLLCARLSELVLDEWYEIAHLENLDEQTANVLNTVLGGST